ncbi:hypothetical protein GCM10007304_33430 [Rhodococcoides trifolii]|uniref:Uncharacterized protein n=1 Tax=Rhodococcoides trifolii TaxID=908250 RepID=A0A917LEQ3_9NOCA|nr:hypothetical protein [Rhodococcus trifolii]GGG16610.1 hypothetical protein GCM10007304_33430 [Rhodococcus trifolii]
MNTVVALALALVGFAVVLAGFVIIARSLRGRMRRGRFHGIDSAVGGSAFMGAPREHGIAPPDHRHPGADTGQTKP